MGPKPAYQNGDWLDGFCFASNVAEDDLEKLASLVGSRLTLKSPNPADQITMIEDAPALEFDLENELTKAFETDDSPQEQGLEFGDAGPSSVNQDDMISQMQAVSDANLSADVELEPAVDSPTITTPVGEVEAVTHLAQPEEPSVDPMLDFNEMIAEELDKALAEEVAADQNLQSDEEADTFPSDEIEEELSKLMSFAVLDDDQTNVVGDDGDDGDGGEAEVKEIQDIARSEPAASNPIDTADPVSISSTPPPPSTPPVPVDVMEPWQEAEVVAEPPMPETSASEAKPSAPSSYTPVQMSEFDPVSAIPQELDSLPHIDDPDPLDAPEDDTAREHIDVVLGGAAALAAAASNKPAVSTNTAKPTGEEPDSSDTVSFDSFGTSGSAVEIAGNDENSSVRLDQADPEQIVEQRRSGRRAAMAIVAIALLGGTAALAWNFVGGDSSDTPTLLASSEPVKVKPKDAGGKVVPNQDQAVYKAVEVQGQEAPTQARLTDNKEKPISVGVSPTGQKIDARIASNQSELINPLAIKPRSVRTVVVRPDGTIVSSTAVKKEPVVVKPDVIPEPLPSSSTSSSTSSPSPSLDNNVVEDLPKITPEAVARLAKTAIPVSRPVRADTPVAKPLVTAPAAKKLTGPAAKIVATPIKDAVKKSVAKPAAVAVKEATIAPKKVAKIAAKVAAAPKSATKPVAKVAGAPTKVIKPVAKVAAAPKAVAKPIAKVAAVPKKVAKPAAKIAAAPKKIAKPVKVAAVTPKPVRKSTNEVLPQVSSPYAVQVSSQLSAAGAKKSYATLTRRYSSILSGKGLDIRKVKVKGKTYYRVRIPADSRSTANQLCGQLKAEGGDCFVTR